MLPRYLLALFLAFPSGLYCADTTVLVSDPHPNHYVLMLDRSGSMVNLAPDREIYRKVLESKIGPGLETTGFGQQIPPMKSGVDSITVLHFGLGDASIPARSWEQLRNIDISEEFISPVMVEDSGKAMPLERVRNLPPNWVDAVFPDKPAELTGLSLARYFGLRAIGDSAGDQEANRTFLIMVDDEETNDLTPWEERRWLLRNMRPDRRPAAEATLARIRKDYSFGPDDAPVWEDQVVSGKKIVFIDAYSIVPSTDRERLERQRKLIAMITPVWTWESGERAHLNIALNPAFSKMLPEARTANWTVRIEVGPLRREISTDYAGLSHIELSGIDNPHCGDPPEILSLTLLIPQAPQIDPLLGKRHFSLEFTRERELPTPFHCTVAGNVTAWSSWTGGLLGMSFLGYCAVFGLLRTHLRIELPGKILTYGMPRGGVRQGWTPVSPKPNMLALSVRLPHPLWQFLLYRGARLTLSNSEGAVLYFHSGLRDQDTFSLPSPLMRVTAFWDGIPQQATKVQVHFKHGFRRGAVTLQYPEGVDYRRFAG